MERASPKSNSLSVQTTLEKTVGKEAKEAIEAMQAQYEEPMQVLEEQLIEADEKVKVAEKKLIAAEQKAETQLAAGTAMLTIEHDNFVKKCAEQTANAEAVSNAAEAKLVETLEELSRLEALQETPSTAAEVEQLKHVQQPRKQHYACRLPSMDPVLKRSARNNYALKPSWWISDLLRASAEPILCRCVFFLSMV